MTNRIDGEGWLARLSRNGLAMRTCLREALLRRRQTKFAKANARPQASARRNACGTNTSCYFPENQETGAAEEFLRLLFRLFNRGEFPEGWPRLPSQLNPDAVLQRGILATSCGSATLRRDFPASALVLGR
jgi:hypothetical protein